MVIDRQKADAIRPRRMIRPELLMTIIPICVTFSVCSLFWMLAKLDGLTRLASAMGDVPLPVTRRLRDQLSMCGVGQGDIVFATASVSMSQMVTGLCAISATVMIFRRSRSEVRSIDYRALGKVFLFFAAITIYLGYFTFTDKLSLVQMNTVLLFLSVAALSSCVIPLWFLLLVGLCVMTSIPIKARFTTRDSAPR